MGGRNHQPCGRYLRNSTRASRLMSLAFAELEMANVSLEDIILLELDGEVGSVDELTKRLGSSLQYLREMATSLSTLRGQMRTEKYGDLPPLRRMDLDLLGDRMRIQGTHRSEGAWKCVADIMKSDGFTAILDRHERSVQKLMQLTTDLGSKVIAVSRDADMGELSVVLEENRLGNFKPEFAALYSAWANFQEEFLASSLISTEVWYNFNRNGSLVTEADSVATKVA